MQAASFYKQKIMPSFFNGGIFGKKPRKNDTPGTEPAPRQRICGAELDETLIRKYISLLESFSKEE
jgi:hypothetical protein